MTTTHSVQGVMIVPLKKVVNQKGYLQEIQRKDDDHFPGFGQVYVTATLPGVVKAWYKHQVQTDQIAILTGLVHLVLFDDRPESTTYHTLQEITLSDETPSLVQIPTGVWHGFKALGEQTACLLHLNDQPFSSQEPDEERLPVTTDSIPFCW